MTAIGRTDIIRLCVLLLVAQTGCATTYTGRQTEWLIIENASPDAIRVSLDLGDRELLLGRVQPMTRATLRIAPAAIPPGRSTARIRIVPVGSPAVLIVPGRLSNSATVASDPYPVEDFARQVWRYAGGRILWVGPSGRPDPAASRR
jgi:hypothetical protein